MEACSHIGNGVEWQWERQRSRHPYCSYNLNCCDSASTSVSTAMSTTSYGVLMPAVLTYGEGETKAGPKWKWRAYAYFLSHVSSATILFLSHISSESVAYDEGRRSSVFVRPASNMWSPSVSDDLTAARALTIDLAVTKLISLVAISPSVQVAPRLLLLLLSISLVSCQRSRVMWQ